MAKVKVYYNEDCTACPPYLADLHEHCSANSHICEIVSLQLNPSDIISHLQSLRESGHSISSLPFFVVSDGEHEYSYEGILKSETIAEVLNHFD